MASTPSERLCHQLVAVSFQLEDEAREFSGNVMVMLEDRRRECNDHAEEIKQLHERVKYNYDRLEPLSEIPLKVSRAYWFRFPSLYCTI